MVQYRKWKQFFLFQNIRPRLLRLQLKRWMLPTSDLIAELSRPLKSAGDELRHSSRISFWPRCLGYADEVHFFFDRVIRQAFKQQTLFILRYSCHVTKSAIIWFVSLTCEKKKKKERKKKHITKTWNFWTTSYGNEISTKTFFNGISIFVGYLMPKLFS